MKVSEWLRDLGLDEYAESFRENRVDAAILRQLTDADLKTLGVEALGDRKRLLTAIAALDANGNGEARSPLQYTPDHLAERILNSRDGLEGELKHVTMLFADIKGSTALIEDLDPEDAARQLSPALSAMIDAVHRFEGTVNRVQGDGIMALFGAPLAHEDHAVRACFAALAIRDSFTGDLDVRVGLHCGDVLVRTIRNDLSMDYDVVGSSTHLAARMEQGAEPGTIRITGAVRSLAEGYIETRPLGTIPVKGIKKDPEVFELVGRTFLGTRWKARAARWMTLFVGRGRELEDLLAAARDTRSGRGQLVAVVGDAGMGKSRLLHEFSRMPQLAGWLQYQSGALPHGGSTPYLPFGILLRAIFEVNDRDDQSRIEDKMLAGIERHAPGADGLSTVMRVLLDLPVTDRNWETLDARQRASRIIDGMKTLLARITARAPTILVFEDLHWVDPGSQKVIDALVARLPVQQLLMIVTYRPEYRHDWADRSYFRQTRIDPLGEESVHEMLDALLGRATGLQAVKRLLIERTEGRPLFVEEMVRSLRETGNLSGEIGAMEIVGDIATIEIPASVQDVLAARIDRLDPEFKQLLQSAAVIGRRVPVYLLRSIVDADEEIKRERLAALQSAEFLYEITDDREFSYRFKHALTEEVAYASLTRDTRRGLHGRLVDAIEIAFSSRLDEHMEELARHALRAERWDKAFVFNREAAKKAHGRSAYAAAIEYFENALHALDQLSVDDSHLTEKMDIRLEMRTALWPLGRHAQLEQRVREAGDLAERAGDNLRHATVFNYLTAHYWQAGEHERAIEHGEKGLALAKVAGDFSALVTTQQHLGVAFQARGEFARQVELHRRVAKDLTGEQSLHRHGMSGYPAIITRAFLAWGLAELGDFDEALHWGKQGIEIANQVNSAMSTIWVTDYLALAYVRRGEFDAAIELLEPNLELCKRAEVRLLATNTHGILGLACCAAGRREEAISLLEYAVSPEYLAHHPQGSGYPLVWLAEAYLRDGRNAEAASAVARALETARRQGESGHEAWACYLRAETERAGGASPETLTASYGLALDLARHSAMRPLAAHCHLGLARAAAAEHNGKPDERELDTARGLFEAMGMRYWLDQCAN